MNFLKKKTTITIEVEHSYNNTKDLLNAVSKHINNKTLEINDRDSFGQFSILGKANIEEVEKNILDLQTSEQRDFIVKKDFSCTDTCYNQPQKQTMKAGTRIKVTGSANNGDVFAEAEDGKRYVINNKNAVKSRCPYDRGLLNMEYFEIV